MARTFLRAYLTGFSDLVKASSDLDRLKFLPQKLEDGELINFNGKSMVGVVDQLAGLELEVIDASRVNDATRYTAALQREYFDGFEKLVALIGNAEEGGDIEDEATTTETKSKEPSLEDQILDIVEAGDKKAFRELRKKLKDQWFALNDDEVEDAILDLGDAVADKDVEWAKEILDGLGEDTTPTTKEEAPVKETKAAKKEEVEPDTDSEDDDELLADFNDAIEDEDVEDAELCLKEMKETNHPKYKECKKIFDNLDVAGDEPEDTVAEEEGSDDEEDIVEEILDDLDKALKDKDVKECQELLEELLEEVGAEDEDYVDYKQKVEALSKPESSRRSRRNRR